MAISKAKKVEIIDTISKGIKEAETVTFVNFHGLTVKEVTELRRNLRAEGVKYYVAKKTLIKRVLSEQGYTGTLPDMPGEIALAWSKDDATAPARDLFEIGKKHKGALTIVGGIWENAFADAFAMNAIATIPPVPVLRGMFVNVINSPIQGLAIVLNQIAETKATA